MKKKESIFQLLTQKPWETPQAELDNLHDGETLNLSKGKLGLRFIMIVSTIFFCLFIVTYSDRMFYSDWRSMPEPVLLWINTIVLFITSGMFISAQAASKKNEFIIVKKRFVLIGIFSLIFLIGQLIVWQDLIKLGYFVSSSPANAYFYLFTALHGLHLIGGLIYWNITIKKVWKPSEVVVEKTKQSVELCAIYWHFLLIVWLVLFILMLLT
ncbi:MAG: putative cytochrome c oxidase subunit 3 [Alphaproteobacteria bacterium MarineAlpha5_Bin11]|nr:MAG: putative cytochrome c oxidase subunit 3 [Alphaproteobacteria bacterium MarineAlpha5_Bin11]PPR52197.1 MAG: putative cytochrome c oxidase subunit 3 [Alphaproteobacteria bacterium MarineAlpha5_Bin10]